MGLFFVIALYLFGISILQTADIILMETTAYRPDTPLLHLCAAALTVCLFAWYGKKVTDKQARAVTVAAACLSCLAAALLVAFARVQPRADQQYALDAAREICRGDFGSLRRGGYLSIHPHQLGLTVVFQLLHLLGGTGADQYLIQAVNAAAVAVCVISSTKIASLMFQRPAVTAATAALLLCFPQLWLYATFLYGNLMGLALSLLAVWMALAFAQSRRARHAALAALFAALSVAVKQNNLITLIAICLFYLADAAGWVSAQGPDPAPRGTGPRPRSRPLLALLACVCATFLLTAGIKICYETVSGEDLDQGAPSVMYVAMGLQDGEYAPGWWNGYIRDGFRRSGYEPETAADSAKRSIHASLDAFAEDPAYAGRFFYEKTASMWINPTFQAFWISTARRHSDIRDTAFVESLFYGGLNAALTGWMNIMQSLTLLGAALYCAEVFARGGRKRDFLAELLPAVAFIGGFAFHLVWEAKGQYAMPYFVLLFPYAARGFLAAGGAAARLWTAQAKV